MSFLTECNSWFNCEDGKKSKDIPWGSFWKWLITSTSDGCPAIRTTATISGDINVTPAAPSEAGLVTSNEYAFGDPQASGNFVQALKIVVETSDDFTGSINGMTRNASRMYTFDMQGKLLPVMAYAVTGGSIKVDVYT